MILYSNKASPEITVGSHIGFFYFKNLLGIPDKKVNPYLGERRIFQTDSQWVPHKRDSTSFVKSLENLKTH